MSFFFFLPFFFFFSPPFSWVSKQAKTLAVCGGGSSCHLASSRGGGILKGKMKCLINLLSAHVCRIAFTHRWKWWKGIVCIAALQFQSGEKSQGPTEPCSAKLIWPCSAGAEKWIKGKRNTGAGTKNLFQTHWSETTVLENVCPHITCKCKHSKLENYHCCPSRWRPWQLSCHSEQRRHGMIFAGFNGSTKIAEDSGWWWMDDGWGVAHGWYTCRPHCLTWPPFFGHAMQPFLHQPYHQEMQES